jgi:hypothetical protein
MALGSAPWGAQAETRLEISGDVTEGAPVMFTDADLANLPQIEFTTNTIWTEGERRFGGPSLHSVLEAVGAGPGDLQLVAANDYQVRMPRDAVGPDYPIIANRLNGEPYGMREKGPLWVVFPYDADTRFQTELTYAYSIWQLTRIEVLEE